MHVSDKPPVSQTERHKVSGEADLLSIGRAIWTKKILIIVPTMLIGAVSLFVVTSLTPLYRSEARVLVEQPDNVYTRPEGSVQQARAEADELAVESQVQLLTSRDLALAVVRKLDLSNRAEFNPPAGQTSFLHSLMSLVRRDTDKMQRSAEDRALQHFYRNLSVFAVTKSRVIVTQYSSEDPVLAADVANTMTEHYLELQQTAKLETTRRASDWLSSQISDLSRRVAESEADVENFRIQENLLVGTNNSTLSAQQLSDFNSNLSNSLNQQTEAQAKADSITAALKSNRPIETLDVANSELMRPLANQRVALAAMIARESRTYLPGHPHMIELTAQSSALEAQIREEARKLARGYENEAKVAAARVATIRNTLNAQKEVAADANKKEVELRALEREARAQRELLEQFLARYRDAASRERADASPPDARIISRAAPQFTPYFPKPVPTVILATLATFVLLIVGVAASEFMAGPPHVPTRRRNGPEHFNGNVGTATT
ncbi:GumC family protein [Terrihabitans sp. B22-R8]|uniref:GumC family protein n=1 Tax=Terrihabitans sp. B22-R8 TaxID=3425128 RepID=UPI00403D0A3D